MNLTGYLSTCVFILAAFVQSVQKCHGSPRTYNGKPCGSTTNYDDGMQGACGCGDGPTDKQFDWSKSGWTVAVNQQFFDIHNRQWCGEKCGICVNLTTTGGFPPDEGSHTPEGQSRVLMIVDLCPSEAPNLDWCAQTSSHPINEFGYGVHFDLEDGAQQITQTLHWDNPEVTYEIVDCAHAHQVDHKTPSPSNYHQCECAHSANGGKKWSKVSVSSVK